MLIARAPRGASALDAEDPLDVAIGEDFDDWAEDVDDGTGERC